MLIKEFFNTKIREEWKETEGKNILVSGSNQVIQFGENWLIKTSEEDCSLTLTTTGQCIWSVKGTVNTSYLYEGTERVMCARCCLAFPPVNCCFWFF